LLTYIDDLQVKESQSQLKENLSKSKVILSCRLRSWRHAHGQITGVLGSYQLERWGNWSLSASTFVLDDIATIDICRSTPRTAESPRLPLGDKSISLLSISMMLESEHFSAPMN